jgi:putative hydrolase of the HAD superfamily
VAGQIKAVIFDLGNVLVDLDPRISAAKLAGYVNKSVEDIYGIFSNSQLIQPFEEGKISTEEFFVRAKEALGFEIEFERFKMIWNGIFFLKPDNLQVYGLIKRLHSSHPTALLSNTNRLHFEYLKSEFPVFDHFHHILLSYEMGLVKPDPRIYRKALDILKADPAEVFYVDDRPELIEAANKMGIRAFVFKGYAQLIKDLAVCGISNVC